MALSDQLADLAARAKKAEDRAAKARTEARSKLEHDVDAARASVDSTTDKLHQRAKDSKGSIATWWNGVQHSWIEQRNGIRDDIATRRAAHDLHAAERNAKAAEDDAQFAIDYAYWAIEEAEYAVLDATLARMDADELAGTSSVLAD